MMPFKFTSDMSQEDAAMQAQMLGVRYDVMPIAPIYESVVGQLYSVFALLLLLNACGGDDIATDAGMADAGTARQYGWSVP